MSKQPLPEPVCYSCRQSNASLKKGYQCGLCQNLLCKKCIFPLNKSFFSFLKEVPEELTHTAYCNTCYHQKVAPAMETYLETMQRAEGLYVFEKASRHVPLIMRSKHKISVENCADRKETILRLAFLAAEQAFNAITGVEVVCEKVRISGYQTSKWSATGYASKIDVLGLREQS